MSAARRPRWRLRATTVWPVVQGSAAATVAWVLAQRLPTDPAGHHDPFFAPIAAFVALNAPLGERGRNAVHLLLGVLAGIAVGEVAVALLPGGFGLRVFTATVVATVIAAGLGGARIVIAQAASGAILTVAVANGHPGLWRLLDAVVGAGVALTFSQLLFSPEPVGLMRRAESAALRDMADGLRLAGEALEGDDDELAEQAVGRLRDMRDRLTELGRARRAGSRIARRSAVWRRRHAPAVRESEDAGHIDLLAGSCLMLARTALVARPDGRRWLAPRVQDLARALEDLATDPGARTARQRAAESALAVVRDLGDSEPPSDPALGAAVAMTRTTAEDLMTFAGVDADEAAAAARDAGARLEVPAPASTPHLRLRRLGEGRWAGLNTGLASLRAAASAARHRYRLRR